MMKLEIIATHEKKIDFVSKNLELFMGTSYSHNAIVVDEAVVYHATEKGFHKMPLSNLLLQCDIRHRFEFVRPIPEFYYAHGWLDGCVGREYSESQYFGFLFPFLKPMLQNGRKKTICSEVVADFMIDCLKIDDDRLSDADWLTPKDIVAVCETHGIRSLKQVKPWP